ncbi:MAG: hypothetical protein ALECFALPRED_009434 [Alectoria fallacina]|uniref:Uncharacterized protein n=1 Tax=Alectoria fallacina TaxID=1903189 RepID=A0A8H3J7C7_9LECA|nr:MAG: hypothetical protein ALECFALPRED_009434 [Alectoria fallacina]
MSSSPTDDASVTRSTGFGLDGFQPLQQDIDPFDGFQLSTPPARHCRRTCPRNGKGHAIGECDGDGALIGVQDEARTHALFVAVDAASDERGGIEALTVKGGMVKGDEAEWEGVAVFVREIVGIVGIVGG